MTDLITLHEAASLLCCSERELRMTSVGEVAAIIGDTPTTLLRVYGHAQIETARPALEKLDARG